jgi:hypothetical protein
MASNLRGDLLGAKSAVESGFSRVGVTATALWVGIFAGPVGFAGAEFVNYVLSKWTCTHQTKSVQGAVTVVALALAAAGGALAWREFTRIRERSTSGDDGSDPGDIAKFMALLGIASSAFTAVAILALGVPPAVLDACL